MDISVIIPSYRDPTLHKTIDSILANFLTEFEIIVVIDGYELQTPIVSDERVRVIRHEENRGMREAINSGVRAATGTYLMRTDEHCMFCHGFDEIVLKHANPNEITTTRRYFLDPYNWELLPRSPIDYERLVIKRMGNGRRKFAAQQWFARTESRRDIMVDETMAWQGSVWVMSRHWWDSVIGELDSNGYGPLYQDSVEMLFKTWLAGGRLMLNKLAWFGHKDRKFRRWHHYPDSRAEPEWRYALDTWREEYRKQWRRWQHK